MTLLSKQLPHRFRESSFRDYEWTIAAIVNAWPNAVDVDTKPTGKSSVTFCCRLRDAIKSFRVNHWPTDAIDTIKFDSEIGDSQITISERPNGILRCGPYESIRDIDSPPPPVIIPPELPSDPQSSGVLLLKTLEEKKLLCLLASRRLLATPLAVGGISFDDAQWLMDNYDVDLVENNGIYELR